MQFSFLFIAKSIIFIVSWHISRRSELESREFEYKNEYFAFAALMVSFETRLKAILRAGYAKLQEKRITEYKKETEAM